MRVEKRKIKAESTVASWFWRDFKGGSEVYEAQLVQDKSSEDSGGYMGSGSLEELRVSVRSWAGQVVVLEMGVI